ncbi:MAG: glycosyltransferase [Rikenellaceae bacterium]|nr:glycosyltransferase [Rikenellaceae bacterium]
MPKISVIMGIYNCEHTLQEALDSLYAQTFQDFEIILCDDGSVDNTYEVARLNQETHPNIVLLKNSCNKGLNQTLNNCLSVANGNYIARMDGDDLSYPERFEIEYRFLEEHPEYAIVSSPMEYFDENGIFMVGKGHGEVKSEDFLYGSPICHAPCMVRKDAYLSVGGYTVDKGLLRVEDYHLWFKMYAAGYKAYMLEQPYYKMRDDRNAKSRRNWTGKKNQYRVKRQGFKMLGFPWYYQVYAFKPLLVGLLPSWLYDILHKNRNKF